MQTTESGTRRFGECALGRGTIFLAVAILPLWPAGDTDRPGLSPCAGADRRSGTITKGPCLLRVYQHRVALMWETDTEGPWGVRYGPPGTRGVYLESFGTRFEPKRRAAPRAVYIHKVWIEDLRPGRVYLYRIVGPTEHSDLHRFQTVPLRADAVTFIVYGDSRSHPDRHRKLVERMIAIKPDFVVHTGDLVDSGKAYEQWDEQFFEPLRGLMENVPIYIAKGNHEGDDGNFERLLIPPGEENDFTFDAGPIHYMCADNISEWVDDERLLRRLVDDAKTSKATWKFVSYHEPSLNFGGHNSDWKRAKALLGFAEARVDFVLTGHSHLYERIRPVAPPRTGGSHVTYITTGGGGASTHDIKPHTCHARTKAVHHFCVFRIKANALRMDVFDIDGRVIDHLVLNKKAGRLSKRYVETAVPMDAVGSHQRRPERKEASKR